jgi:excisionase family DNA binding protein
MTNDLAEGLRLLIADAVRREMARIGQQPSDEYLSTASAAKLADVAEVTIRRWIRHGKLKAFRAGRLLRVSRADLERLLRSGRTLDAENATPEQLAKQRYG